MNLMSPMRCLAASLFLASLTLSTAHAGSPQEEANRKMVLEFYERVLNQKDADAATQYIGSTYRQHNPLVPDGVAALQAYVRGLKERSPQSRSIVKRSFVDGDHVILHVHAIRAPEERGVAIVDIFRVENGKIVEHWDVIQPVPEKSANTNTMF